MVLHIEGLQIGHLFLPLALCQLDLEQAGIVRISKARKHPFGWVTQHSNVFLFELKACIPARFFCHLKGPSTFQLLRHDLLMATPIIFDLEQTGIVRISKARKHPFGWVTQHSNVFLFELKTCIPARFFCQLKGPSTFQLL